MTKATWDVWDDMTLIEKLHNMPLQDLRALLHGNGLTDLIRDLSGLWSSDTKKSAYEVGVHTQDLIEQVLDHGLTPAMAEAWLAGNVAASVPATASTQSSVAPVSAPARRRSSLAVIYREGTEEMFFGPFDSMAMACHVTETRRAQFLCDADRFTIVKMYPN